MRIRLLFTHVIKALIFCLGIVLLVSEVSGQEIKGRPFVQNYSYDDYRAGLQNWQVGQSDQGILYFANNTGLLNYDGVTWRVFQTPQNDNVRSFDIGPDGRVYMGSGVTFGYFERDSLGYYEYVSISTPDRVNLDEFTEVWTTYYTGEYVFYQSRTRLYRVQELEDGDWDIKTWDPEDDKLFMYAFWVDGVYYVHQRGVGLHKMVGDELTFIEGSEVLANDRMQVMLNLDNSTDGSARYLLAQFRNGVYVFDGTSFERLELSDPEVSNQATIYKGLRLDDGRMVLGTLTGGAVIIDADGNVLDRFDENSGVIGNTVYSIFQDEAGSLWLGMSNGIARIEVASPLTQFTVDDGVEGTPFSVRKYRDDLYVGTGNYVLKYNRRTRHMERIENVPVAQIFSMEVIDDCLLFTGMGLFQICGDDLTTIKASVAGDFQVRFVTQGIKDPSLIYVGSIEGMSVFRRTNPGDQVPQWKYLGKVQETINAEVRSIHPQPDGSVWINGFTSGLFLMKDNEGGGASPDKPYTIEHFDEENGLVDGGAAPMELFGETYFIGQDSCYKFNSDQSQFVAVSDLDNAFGDDGGGIFAALPYSGELAVMTAGSRTTFAKRESDGSFSFDQGPFASFEGQGVSDFDVEPGGRAWFSTNDAIIQYDPTGSTELKIDFKTVIMEVRAGEDNMSITQFFGDSGPIPSLPHDHEAIRFEFAAPYYIDEERTEYQFWLEGFSKEWSDWGYEKYKEFTNLPARTYTFHVRARNLFDKVGEEARYKFTVTSPWYATWWAYILYIVLGLGLISLIVRNRTRQLKKRSEELERTVSERTAEITKQVGRQQALFDLSSRIAAAETEDEICNAVVLGLQSDAFDFPFIGVFIKDELTGDRVLKASSGGEGVDQVQRIPAGEGLSNRILEGHEFLYTPDVSVEPDHYSFGWKGSEVDVPIKVGDDVMGVLVVEHQDKNRYSQQHFDILTTAASQAGVALGQAISHEQVEQRLRELRTVDEISQLITTKLDQRQLFELIGESMREIFNAQIVYIALYDQESGIITFPWQYGDVLKPMQYGEGLTSKVIRDNKPLLINEAMQSRHEEMGIAPKGLTAASYLGVPIPTEDRVIGVLSVQSTEIEGRFDQNDMRLLQTIATHVGIAIQNSSLFEELQSAKAEAEQANEAKSAFLSTVSHELRTPLTSVLGFAKIIKKRLTDKVFPLIDDDNPKVNKTKRQVVENLDVVVAEGERLTGLINDVLDLAKIEAGKVEWHMTSVDIHDIVSRATAATSSLFETSDLTLKLEEGQDLPQVNGDENKLIQVLINLLSNAVKFTDEGSITVKTASRNGEVVLSVSDTGSGISQVDQDKIFDKFKQVGDTLTDKPKGTGLGLPISKEIIEHHGGQIWVESEEGKGSTFFFSLPAEDSIPQEQRPIDLGKLVEQLRTQVGVKDALDASVTNHILVVDDEPNIRSLLKQELSEAGFEVSEAGNGKAALDQIREQRPDLIILDVMMPEMNGFDLAAVLKNDPQTMEIPIIILSVLQDKERGYRLGIDRYLTKPIEIEKLFSEIEHLLEQGKSKKKVMVVDEDQSTIKTLADVLQSQGFHVVEANGSELVQNVIDSKPDIILLNSLMSENHDIIKSVRFEKGMENVLFLIYQ